MTIVKGVTLEPRTIILGLQERQSEFLAAYFPRLFLESNICPKLANSSPFRGVLSVFFDVFPKWEFEDGRQKLRYQINKWIHPKPPIISGKSIKKTYSPYSSKSFLVLIHFHQYFQYLFEVSFHSLKMVASNHVFTPRCGWKSPNSHLSELEFREPLWLESWSTCSPPRISQALWSGLINHWFPLIRPPYFWEGYVWGGLVD